MGLLEGLKQIGFMAFSIELNDLNILFREPFINFCQYSTNKYINSWYKKNFIFSKKFVSLCRKIDSKKFS